MNNPNMFSLIPGSHTNIMFWLDCWCGTVRFKNKFPLLYELESVKSVMLLNGFPSQALHGDGRLYFVDPMF